MGGMKTRFGLMQAGNLTGKWHKLLGYPDDLKCLMYPAIHRYYAGFLEQPFGAKNFITQKLTKGGLRWKRLKEPCEKKIAQKGEFCTWHLS
jgi:hypothetical protein